MHEMAIVQEVVAIVAEVSEGRQVRRIVLEIGKLSTVLPDAVRFCFDLAARGTVAEGATLEIVEISGYARCRSCEGQMVLEELVGRCVCGETDLEWLAGQELRVTGLEMT